MKKVISVLLIIACLFMLVACGDKKEEVKHQDNPKEVNDSETVEVLPVEENTNTSDENAAKTIDTIDPNAGMEETEEIEFEENTTSVTPSTPTTNTPTETNQGSSDNTSSSNDNTSSGGETHTHTVVVDAAVAATCSQTGLTEGSHCSECGAVIKAQEVIPLLDHSYTKEGICIYCDKQKDTSAGDVTLPSQPISGN